MEVHQVRRVARSRVSIQGIRRQRCEGPKGTRAHISDTGVIGRWVRRAEEARRRAAAQGSTWTGVHAPVREVGGFGCSICGRFARELRGLAFRCEGFRRTRGVELRHGKSRAMPRQGR